MEGRFHATNVSRPNPCQSADRGEPIMHIAGMAAPVENDCPEVAPSIVVILKNDIMKQETKNQYLLLFRGRDWDEGLSTEELQEVMDRVMAWFDGVQQTGKVKAGQPLARQGRIVSGKGVADGPFAESKEAIGGYLLLEADDLEEAVAVARTCPTLDYEISVEVRPVLDECPCFKRARERLALVTA